MMGEQDTKVGTKVIVVLGSTGGGKSSLCNVWIGRDPDSDDFPVGDFTESETLTTRKKDGFWLGGDQPVTLIDTPGMDDTSGNDEKHIKELADKLKSVEYVNAFIIVLNAAQPRFDAAIQRMMDDFKRMYGNNFMRNTVIVFSRWEFGDKKRERKNITHEKFTTKWKEEFDKRYKFPKIPIFYVDSHYDRDEQGATTYFNQETNKLWDTMMSMTPYDCKDVTAVKRLLEAEQEKNKMLENRITNLEQYIEAVKNEKENLENEMKKLEQENNAVKWDRQDLEIEKKKLEQDNEAVKKEKQNLVNRMWIGISGTVGAVVTGAAAVIVGPNVLAAGGTAFAAEVAGSVKAAAAAAAAAAAGAAATVPAISAGAAALVSAVGGFVGGTIGYFINKHKTKD